MTDHVYQQRNKVLLNMIAQLIYSPNERDSQSICEFIGINKDKLFMSDKSVMVDAIIRGLLDKEPYVPPYFRKVNAALTEQEARAKGLVP